MLSWSHALLLSLLVALGAALAVRWAQLDSERPARISHPYWLLGPILVVLVGAAGVGWSIHLRPAGVDGLRMVYEHSLLPATLAVALAAAVTVAATTGRSAWACAALMLSALAAAAVIRLDTRVLHFVTDSNNAAVRDWFIDRLIPVWPWRSALLKLSGCALSVSLILAVLQRPSGLSRVLAGAVLAAVVLTGNALSSGWGAVVDPDTRAALAKRRMPVLEAPGPLARPAQAGMTIDEPGVQLSSLALTPPLRILVALPGTETLPETLRWIGWREVAIGASDVPKTIHLFGAAGQVWLILEGESQALGALSHAPARLSALGITGSATIQPDVDWTLGDLAALCVSVGGDCALSQSRTQAAKR